MRRQGYVSVELSEAEDMILKAALLHFDAAKTFRYPPRDEEEPRAEMSMPEEYRCAFNLLYSIAARAAQKLRATATTEMLPADLHHDLPTEACRKGHLPFYAMEKAVPFSASFFNIFNYDHGCLNVHSDVGIVTAVYGMDGTQLLHQLEQNLEIAQTEQPSRLWLREVTSEGAQWVAAPGGRLLLWTGDALGLQGFDSIEHCVRVDPCGKYVSHSHSTRDPKAPDVGNRRSIALVLDEDAGFSNG